MFSCEVSQIFNNIFFTEHLWWLSLGNGIQNWSIRLDWKLLKLLQQSNLVPRAILKIRRKGAIGTNNKGLHQSTTEKCPCKSWDLLQKRIYYSTEHLRWRLFWKLLMPLPVHCLRKKAPSQLFDWVLNTPFCNINKPRLHHAVFLKYFFRNYRKSMNSYFSKLWITIWNDPKNSSSHKSICRINQRGIRRYYPKHR